MDIQKANQILQLSYAAVLADAVTQYGREGVLEQVTARKRAEQMATGAMKAAQFGVSAPEEIFTRLSEIFNCAAWQVAAEDGGFVAEARACKLCAIAKKMNAPAPCTVYCLNPMEGMVKGLRPTAEYVVEETLWDGEQCRVRVRE
jgi:hypothetical protein